MHACALTDIGRKRQSNQDVVFCSENPLGNLPNLFAVADGMGGHKAGDYASRTAVEILLDHVKNTDSHDPGVILQESIEEMNSVIWHRSRENADYAGMGTTLVAAVIEGSTLTVANIGDSRLYVVGRGLYQVTKDHSLVEELVDQGKLVRGSAEYRAKKNVITRAIGVGESVKADFFEVELAEGEGVLLCSDGLTNMITEEEIFSIISRRQSLEDRSAALVEAANLSGGRDNIAVILIER